MSLLRSAWALAPRLLSASAAVVVSSVAAAAWCLTVGAWWPAGLSALVALAGFAVVASVLVVCSLADEVGRLRGLLVAEKERSAALSADLDEAFDRLGTERDRTTHLRVALGLQDPPGPL